MQAAVYMSEVTRMFRKGDYYYFIAGARVLTKEELEAAKEGLELSKLAALEKLLAE